MNANELAEKLLQNNLVSWGKCTPEDHDNAIWTNEQAATMLRQQQAEIEALKKDNKELHAIAQQMAMAESDARKSLQWIKDVEAMGSCAHTELTLTEKEIIELADECRRLQKPNIEFARAILRKAQEK
jgi:erythromycin esterase-like protein